MLPQINKRIYIFFFLFLTLSSLSNKNVLQFNFIDDYNLTLIDKSEINENLIIRDLSILQKENLFFLKKEKIFEVIKFFPAVENYSIFKNYPSKIYIDIQRTKFLAITKKHGNDFYVGSNGNLIKAENKKKLPYIFGDLDIEEFYKIKKIIDNSDFNFDDIKNFYYFKSKRWDIETNSGLIIKLPSENIETAFQTLLKVIQSKKITNFNKIDLRQTGQIILDE